MRAEPLLSKPPLILRREGEAIGPDSKGSPPLLIGVKIEALDDIDHKQSCAESLDRPSTNHQVGLSEFVDPALNRRRVQVAAQERATPAGRVGDSDDDGAAVAVGEADSRLDQHLDGFLAVGRGLLEVKRLALQDGGSNAAVNLSEQFVEVVG